MCLCKLIMAVVKIDVLVQFDNGSGQKLTIMIVKIDVLLQIDTDFPVKLKGRLLCIALQMALLEIQQSERSDTSFNRGCLFCPQVLKGNRSVLFSHMLEEHGFTVGLPDNLGEWVETVGVDGTGVGLLLFAFRQCLWENLLTFSSTS